MLRQSLIVFLISFQVVDSRHPVFYIALILRVALLYYNNRCGFACFFLHR